MWLRFSEQVATVAGWREAGHPLRDHSRSSQFGLTAEVEKMIGELQAAKDFLECEGERVQREAEHYTTLTQMASASVKIISDSRSQRSSGRGRSLARKSAKRICFLSTPTEK